MRKIFKVVGIVALLTMVGAAIYAHEPQRAVHRGLYHQALTEYADHMPTLMCNDLHAIACDLVNVDAATGTPGLLTIPPGGSIPTPLPPKIITYDAPADSFTTTPPRLNSDIANAAMQWLWPILMPILAGFIVDALIKIRAYFGQTTSDAQRDKLQQIAENGLNLAQHKLNAVAAGAPLPTKQQIMAEAVDYVQAHGADTIKALGMDPTDPKTVEAIKGHVSTLMQKQADLSATAA